jgi:hypothetical protein
MVGAGKTSGTHRAMAAEGRFRGRIIVRRDVVVNVWYLGVYLQPLIGSA